MDSFALWLVQEREKRGWSQSQLAKKMGVSQAAVSRVESESIPQTAKFVSAVAKAFGIPEEQAYRVAGILPENDADPWAEEMAYLFNHIRNPIYRDTAKELIRHFVRKEEKDKKEQDKK